MFVVILSFRDQHTDRVRPIAKTHKECCLFSMCGDYPRPRGFLLNTYKKCNPAEGYHWERFVPEVSSGLDERNNSPNSPAKSYVPDFQGIGCCISEHPDCPSDQIDRFITPPFSHECTVLMLNFNPDIVARNKSIHVVRINFRLSAVL